jgi:hypothetical protein
VSIEKNAEAWLSSAVWVFINFHNREAGAAGSGVDKILEDQSFQYK